MPSLHPQPPIAFRPLAFDDLPLMVRWLNTPHVRRWWQHDPRTLEEAAAKYTPLIEGREPTAAYIILYDERPIGYIQAYRIADWPDYARDIAVEAGAAGVDLFIGEEECVHRGLGAPILRAFLRGVVFAMAGVTCCIIGPSASNASAIRAYEKAGFRYLKTISVPGEEEPEYLMRAGPLASSPTTASSALHQ
jgi:RimJ/RimL family protein N-acetyltransferase